MLFLKPFVCKVMNIFITHAWVVVSQLSEDFWWYVVVLCIWCIAEMRYGGRDRIRLDTWTHNSSWSLNFFRYRSTAWNQLRKWLLHRTLSAKTHASTIDLSSSPYFTSYMWLNPQNCFLTFLYSWPGLLILGRMHSW